MSVNDMPAGELTHVQYAQNVDRPKSPVHEHFEDHFDGEPLAIVHVRLRRVISDYTIHHDDFFPTRSLAKRYTNHYANTAGPTAH